MTHEATRLERLYRWTFRHGRLAAVLDFAGKVIVAMTAVAYILSLIGTALGDIILMLKFAAVTVAPFLLVSVFRHVFDAPRPYELYDLSDILGKSSERKNGHSFPSRHVFSSFAIGSALCFIQPIVGGVILVLGVCLGACRILLANHFPRDVVAGALIGALCGSGGMLLMNLF